MGEVGFSIECDSDMTWIRFRETNFKESSVDNSNSSQEPQEPPIFIG